MPVDSLERLLTPAQAARVLDVTPEAIRKMERRGQLPAYRTGTGWRLFDPDDIEKLRAQRIARSERVE